ncbi:MAG TPA: 30S ribosomal protein S6 [Verrucomicrobiae bacterium]
MKRYEGLFILNTAGKEEGIKDMIDKISAEISAAGGKVETTQKMEKKNFARVADKKFTSGFYLNVIFEGEENSISKLRNHLVLNEDIQRVMFTVAPEPKKVGLGLAQ